MQTAKEGQIAKIVRYTKIGDTQFYNLGFGDKLGNTNDFDDKVVSDNKDMMKVLATVAETIYMFTEENPQAMVIARGSTDARTRLYQIAISNNLEDILEDFSVFGLTNDGWQEFEKNHNYKSFLIKLKWN